MSTQIAAALPKVLVLVVKEHQFSSTEDEEDVESELRLLNQSLLSNAC